jgi:2-oxoacid:acceptor oxidoreductase gamma subunit (pyruvate/2-ketoisovalerate family)/2-oxoacid:acceptor oxidoreductase delta subunit (pyruvate/2-ketoisovalerate family)
MFVRDGPVMTEMLLVGRGGDGVLLASQILAETFARAGLWVQSFPEFTAERRGAPISAFLRWDETPIHRRYKVREPDVVVVVSSAPPSPEALRSVKAGGLIILNRETRFPHAGPFEVARVPAARIARENAILSSDGRPMGNTAVLGACVRLLLPDGLPFLEQAIESRMGSAARANVTGAREGYARCTTQHTLAGDTPIEPASAAAPRPSAPAPRFPVSTMDSHLSHTGAWSLERPVLRDACTGCAVCALFCPEGAISRSEGSMSIDLLYCKGCGICEVVCPVRNAIAMEEVPV